MKRWLIIPLVVLAAGCGSKQNTATVTVTRHDEVNSISSSSCRQAMEMLIGTTGLGIDAADAYVNGNYSKGTHKITRITHRLTIVKPLVELCRSQ